MLRFTHFFGNLWAKKCFFRSKTVFLGKEVHYYMVHIAYITELNLQICNYVQKRRICRENCKYAFDENFHGHFCPRRKAAMFCHPDGNICIYFLSESIHMFFDKEPASEVITTCIAPHIISSSLLHGNTYNICPEILSLYFTDFFYKICPHVFV